MVGLSMVCVLDTFPLSYDIQGMRNFLRNSSILESAESKNGSLPLHWDNLRIPITPKFSYNIYDNEKILSRWTSSYTYKIIIKYDPGDKLGDKPLRKGQGKLQLFCGNGER